jgi:ABC-type branched-subunit amino acid transport system ATPase component
MGSDALRLSGVVKRFGGNTAVGGVSGVFADGVVTGLIGPNGSGKTTLINLINRFYDIDEGSIELDGRALDRVPAHRIAALGVVRTFQMPKSLASMTVTENLLVTVTADHRRESWAAVRTDVAEALDLTGLTHLAGRPAGELSGGQTMLLQLGRIFMQRPVRVLLLDEPFAGVAPAIKERIVTAILRIRDMHGCAVLLVSHEMATVRRLCERVVVMNAGRVIADGTLDEVVSDPAVVDAYLGRPA